jgi:hypothetical protein
MTVTTVTNTESEFYPTSTKVSKTTMTNAPCATVHTVLEKQGEQETQEGQDEARSTLEGKIQTMQCVIL